jgi:hypothetical protein
VCYVSIVDEEVQNVLMIFMEAIGSNSDQTWELVVLQEVVGYKRSLMLQLVELPKTPRLIGGTQFFKSTEGILRVEEGMVRLVELS